MRNSANTFGILLPSAYCLAVLAATIFMFANAAKTAFCGLYLILVTLPWSMFFLSILPKVSSPNVWGIPVWMLLIMGGSALLNTIVLYWLGSLLDGGFTSRRSDNTDRTRVD